jgi:hypothetical protein
MLSPRLCASRALTVSAKASASALVSKRYAFSRQRPSTAIRGAQERGPPPFQFA